MLTNKELTRVEPRAFVRRMLRDFDRFFEEGWTPFAAPARVFGEFAWAPTLEVVEKNHHLVARFELPGMKKEEITVTDPNGQKRKEKLSFQGISTLRAAGTRDGDGSPGKSRVAHDTAKSSNKQLPAGEWATLTVVGEPGHEYLWIAFRHGHELNVGVRGPDD